jgi:hypothetical protein
MEAFPCSTELAREVVRVLITEIILCFSLPRSLQSDNGPAFKIEVTWGLSRALSTETSPLCLVSPIIRKTCFLLFLGPTIAIILLLVFGPCILSLLVKFVFSHLESIKLQMPLMEMKMTYYHGPLNNPSSGQPWCHGPFITLFIRNQSLNRLCFSYCS